MELVSVEREEHGATIVRVVRDDQLPDMLADGWTVMDEKPFDLDKIKSIQHGVLKPLYADMAYNVKDLKDGQRVPLSGTRKQQLAEAQHIADQKLGEGKVEAQW